jgi:hypothetical protein
MEPAAPPLTVATLLGHAQVPMARVCLESLVRCSAEPLRLRLHDDGTLTPEDAEDLAAALGGAEVVWRAEADERVAGPLARYPATRAFRAASPLALKLVDVALLTPGEALAYCDADVLFLRRFSGLYRFPSPAAGAVFMADTQNAYSLRSWHLLRDRRLRIPLRVNSGIILFRMALGDPDFVEWFLAQEAYRFAPPWVEQTGWALLGGRAGCWLLDPAQVRIPVGPGENGAVALHFVRSVRGLLPGYVAGHAEAAEGDGPPAVLQSAAALRCGPLALAASEGRRLFRRLAPRALRR